MPGTTQRLSIILILGINACGRFDTVWYNVHAGLVICLSIGGTMNIKHRFDAEKAVEAFLYVGRQVPNLYHALKVLYFADKEHLSRFGRLISGDRYVAMRLGPVPSGVYDMVKQVRGDGHFRTDIPLDEIFEIRHRHTIHPKRLANVDLLSESDVECLDRAIDEYGSLSFKRLKSYSHREAAFKSADENDFISLEAMAKSLPDGHSLWEYLGSA
jgi:uncharacterized phage-associated protein